MTAVWSGHGAAAAMTKGQAKALAAYWPHFLNQVEAYDGLVKGAGLGQLASWCLLVGYQCVDDEGARSWVPATAPASG